MLPLQLIDSCTVPLPCPHTTTSPSSCIWVKVERVDRLGFVFLARSLCVCDEVFVGGGVGGFSQGETFDLPPSEVTD